VSYRGQLSSSNPTSSCIHTGGTAMYRSWVNIKSAAPESQGRRFNYCQGPKVAFFASVNLG
jgi:hypothetical protein